MRTAILFIIGIILIYYNASKSNCITILFLLKNIIEMNCEGYMFRVSFTCISRYNINLELLHCLLLVLNARPIHEAGTIFRVRHNYGNTHFIIVLDKKTV